MIASSRAVRTLVLALMLVGCSSNAPRPAPPGLSPEGLALSPGAMVGAVLMVGVVGAFAPSYPSSDDAIVAGAAAGHLIGGGAAAPPGATVLRVVPAAFVDRGGPSHAPLAPSTCAAICSNTGSGCWIVEHHAPKHTPRALRPAIDCHDGRLAFISSVRLGQLRAEADGDALEGAACTGACGARQTTCSLVGGPSEPVEPVGADERLVLCAPESAANRSSGITDSRATVP
jgi:hypothetical protein